MKLGVYIGRFQPFHLGHLHVVRQALAQVDRLLILIGSAGEPRTVTNPWTADERASMILHGLPGDIPDVVDFGQIQDHGDDRVWAMGVRIAVAKHLQDLGRPEAEILLAGHAKDHTSFYLKMFPQWGSIDVDNHRRLSSTPIRERFFTRAEDLSAGEVGSGVRSWAEEWYMVSGQAVASVAREYAAVRKFQLPWLMAPHKPTFITSDALVVSDDHVAMIRRGGDFGHGLMALPGGFLEPHLTLRQNAIKEFSEETRDGADVEAWGMFPGAVRVFDKPGRDPRGRFVTHVHLYHMPEGFRPRLQAGDDAKWAGWVHVDEIKREEMFVDHFQILQMMFPRREIA